MRPGEVTPITKEEQSGRERGSCPRTGDALRTCKCRTCIGRRNRRKGQRKQRAAAKALGVPKPKFASQMGHEERMRGACRIEVKAGRQVQRMASQFLAAEKQSDDGAAIGDPRPFHMVAMPDGWAVGEGLVTFRLSQLARVVEAYVNWEGP